MIGVLRADEYYTPLRPGGVLNQLYEIGQLFWAPSMFLLDNHRRYLVRNSYSESAGESHTLEQTDLRTEFDQPREMSHTLGIRSDERALIVGAKRRPVILLSKAAATWSDGRRRNDDCYLVVPVYSFSRDETRESYSTAFIDRVKGYIYWQIFYLPPMANGRIREGFARLDRIQTVHKELLRQIPVMLSEDALELLRDWIRVYLGEDLQIVNDMLFDYREEAIRQLS